MSGTDLGDISPNHMSGADLGVISTNHMSGGGADLGIISTPMEETEMMDSTPSAISTTAIPHQIVSPAAGRSLLTPNKQQSECVLLHLMLLPAMLMLLPAMLMLKVY